MATGNYGTIRPADVSVEDVEIFYSYTPNRESITSVELFPLDPSQVLIPASDPNNGTEIFGGVALNKAGVLFITGTDDNYIYAMDVNSGKIIWEFEMDAAGSAPPTIFEIDGKEYVSVLSTGGLYYSYDKKDSSVYTFAIK